MNNFFDPLKAVWRSRRLTRRLARARARPTPERIHPLAIRLLALGRIAEAEALVELGLARAPDDLGLREQHAFCAHNGGRYHAALERWTDVSVRSPTLPMAWCGIASNARELGRNAEATAAIDEALRRFPDDVVVLSEAARVRETCGAYAEAADLWRRILPHPAADPHWHLALAANLIPLGRYDEAEAIVVDLARKTAPADPLAAARRWGHAAEMAANSSRERLTLYAGEAVSRFGEHAFAVRQVAETTLDLDRAAAALAALVERQPSDLEARESFVRVLLRSDRTEEAQSQIAAAMQLAPGHQTFEALRGLAALRSHDLATAYAIACEYAARHPHDFAAANMIDRLNRVRALEDAEQASAGLRPTPIAPAQRDDCEVRQLMLGFESLGQDCEFGTVQRAYGAEPLGLLRWTNTDVPSLLASFSARFEGIGDPNLTELVVGEVGEILVRDKRWNLAMHTFLYEKEVSMAVLHPKMCRRAAYLRDKLLSELETGEKILVFKSDRADAKDLAGLHEAILRIGPNALLNVRHVSGGLSMPPGDAGTVREIGDGLFVGYLSRHSILQDPAYEEWVAVCQDMRRRLGVTRLAPAA